MARASNGETVEITGAGSLSGKSVIAVGSFTEKNSNGYIVTNGVWAATGLMSFESYGIDPGALLSDQPQFRRLAPLPMGGMMPGPMARLMAGPIAAGGVAVIRIRFYRLLPDAGSPTDALLQVNCAKGKVPEDGQGDGIRLTIEGGGPVFDEQLSGHIVFMLRRPAPNFAWKEAAGPTQ